jgi:hypothetical protein
MTAEMKKKAAHSFFTSYCGLSESMVKQHQAILIWFLFGVAQSVEGTKTYKK